MADDTTNEREMFKASVEAQMLAEAFAETEVDEVLTYEEMSTLIGRDVREIRHVIETARRRLLRENGAVFASVRNVGVKRLSPDETVDESESVAKRSRNANRKALRLLGTIEYEKLTGDKRNEYTALQAQARIVDLTLRARNKRKLEALASGDSKPLAIGDAMQRLFNVGGCED